MTPHDPKTLVDARRELHVAAQAVASVGHTLAEKEADYSHTALRLEDGVLWGVTVGGRRAGLDVERAVLRLDETAVQGSRPHQCALRGHTLSGAVTWLEARLGHELDRPAHELPAHPVLDDDETFRFADAGARARIAEWLQLAQTKIGEVVATRSGAQPILSWPHHFDLASLVVHSGSGEEMRSVGVGWSPGDGGIQEPYFYVTPWPKPSDATTPELPAGRWNTEGWFGAVLTGTEALETDIDAFLRPAFEQAWSMISGS